MIFAVPESNVIAVILTCAAPDRVEIVDLHRDWPVDCGQTRPARMRVRAGSLRLSLPASIVSTDMGGERVATVVPTDMGDERVARGSCAAPLLAALARGARLDLDGAPPLPAMPAALVAGFARACAGA